MHIKNKKGQSTVEYILLVTAVVAVGIVFLAGNGAGTFKGQLNATLNQATADMNTMSDTLASSHQPSPPSAGGPPPITVNPANESL